MFDLDLQVQISNRKPDWLFNTLAEPGQQSPDF